MSAGTTDARHRPLGLTDAEYDAIVARLEREPNDLELAVFSLMWSEHCAYKHSKKLLRRLPTKGPHVVMGPGENAGAVDVGNGLAVAFKVESHNHPSAVEPFQGAATGVGGILRDVFAVGARPIAILDSLRFGELDSERSRYLLDHVVAGIGHYGNSIGVATVGGEIYFEAPYEQNCLVNAMCLGIAPQERLVRSAAAGVGNHLVLLGALTGRDGIGGASVLASAELGEEDEAKRPSVQIGDPFEESKLVECCLELLDAGLLESLQDLGAAGLSSSSSEMASKGEVGLDIDISRVPLREEAMEPFEIMISESQERMLCVVAPERLDEVLALCARWEVRATPIGTVTDTRQLRVLDGSDVVGDIPVEALVDDCPLYDLEPEAPSSPVYANPPRVLADDASPADTLVALLRSPSITSKRWAFEQYDSIVGSRTVRRPEGADAAVLSLANDGGEGALAVSIDGNGRRVACDPYTGAIEAVVECATNLACVGAEPLGLTNCLNFGNPEKPHIAWQLTRAVEGLADACDALGVPVVGGNVSLYNEGGGGPIYPTPIVGMVGKLPDPATAAGIGFAGEGDQIALLGPFNPSLAGSELEKLRGGLAEGLPALELEAQAEALALLRRTVRGGGLSSAHDISDGGLACALAECCIAGGIGARVDLAPLIARVPDGDPTVALFGEGVGGVVVSGPLETIEGLAEEARTETLILLGEVAGDSLDLTAGVARLSLPVEEARAAHERGLPDPFLMTPQEPISFRDGPRDECGVFGVYAPESDVARLAYFALYALQHRGQESAGIATSEDGHIMALRDLGLVSQVFDEAKLRALTGTMALGHVRYSTTGSSAWENSQPIHRSDRRELALAHNGNLINAVDLHLELRAEGVQFSSTSDSEIIAALLSMHEADDILDAVEDVLPRLEGAFSTAVMTQDEIVAFRDPAGLRPLAIGRLGDRYCVASESCAFDIIGAEMLREVQPGEAVAISERGIEVRQVVEGARRAFCVFEHIYFARPDSQLEGRLAQVSRRKMGEILWREAPVEADLVIAVPDSGNAAANGYAQASGIFKDDGLIKNRYVARTFIQPGQELRKHGLRMKFNPLPEIVGGKRIVVVDDSIVRGNTTRQIVKMLRDAGASEVHLRISAPPIRHPCHYGIDMSTTQEMIAHGRTIDEVAAELGCDSLAYLSVDGLYEAIGLGRETHCDACFTGEYPLEHTDSANGKFALEDSAVQLPVLPRA